MFDVFGKWVWAAYTGQAIQSMGVRLAVTREVNRFVFYLTITDILFSE